MNMDILRCVVIASCIWGSVHGGYYDEEHNYDRSCVDCADISDFYRRDCLCRTYTFAFYGSFGMEYWNGETGEPEGPAVEVVKKVCEYANRDCAMVFVEKWMCWTRGTSEVLNGRWYDVCAGLTRTASKGRVYAFPKYGYMQFGNWILLAQAGSNITEAMVRDPTNDFTLAFLTNPNYLDEDVLNAFYDAGFYAKLHNLRGIVSPPTREGNAKLVDMISEPECDKDDQDDGSESADLIIHLDLSLVPNNFTFVAEIEGHKFTYSLMFRRDDRCLMSWWDDAYEAFICSDGYLDFCQGLNAAGGNMWDICQNRTMCME